VIRVGRRSQSRPFKVSFNNGPIGGRQTPLHKPRLLCFGCFPRDRDFIKNASYRRRAWSWGVPQYPPQDLRRSSFGARARPGISALSRYHILADAHRNCVSRVTSISTGLRPHVLMWVRYIPCAGPGRQRNDLSSPAPQFSPDNCNAKRPCHKRSRFRQSNMQL